MSEAILKTVQEAVDDFMGAINFDASGYSEQTLRADVENFQSDDRSYRGACRWPDSLVEREIRDWCEAKRLKIKIDAARAYTLMVPMQSFHGPYHLPISGTNWRAWNDHMLAVDMRADQAREMYDASICGIRDCKCSPGYTADPSQNVRRDGAGTYLVPANWAYVAGAENHPALRQAIADAQTLRAERNGA